MADRFEYWEQHLPAALKSWDSDLCMAEFHGALCGVISAGHASTTTGAISTLSQVVGANLSGATVMLESLVEQVLDDFQAEHFGLQLLISDQDPKQRLTDLADWTHGYLLGVNWGQQKGEPPADIQQAMSDLVEISRVSVEDSIDPADLEEVYEYVRMTALLVFAEQAKNTK